MTANNDSVLDAVLRGGTAQASASVLVAAGGTGGHLFPAEALAAALARRNVAVALATNSRAARHAGAFAAAGVHVIPSATIRGRNPFSLAKTGTMLGYGVLKAWFKLPRIKPAVVVGFGGYPSIPPLLAATARGIPTVIHEQNAVMGRANRMLAPRVRAIATGFAGILNREPALAAKATHTGNPVRPAVIAAAATPYPALDTNGEFRLLVFGGSQGARVMADVVPLAIERLEPHLQMRLKIVQQAREEDMRAGARDLRETQYRGGGRAVLQGSAGADGGEPSGGGALRRVDRGGTVGDRPARHSGAVAARTRSGPASTTPACWWRRAVRSGCRRPNSRRTGWRRKSRRWLPSRRGWPGWRQAAKRAGAIDAADRLADLVLRVAGITQ